MADGLTKANESFFFATRWAAHGAGGRGLMKMAGDRHPRLGLAIPRIVTPQRRGPVSGPLLNMCSAALPELRRPTLTHAAAPASSRCALESPRRRRRRGAARRDESSWLRARTSWRPGRLFGVARATPAPGRDEFCRFRQASISRRAASRLRVVDEGVEAAAVWLHRPIGAAPNTRLVCVGAVPP